MLITSNRPHLPTSRNSNLRRPTTLIPFRRHNLVIKAPQVQPDRRPRIEVVLRRNRPAHALSLAYRPVLLEGLGTVNRRCIGARADIDVVGATIGRDGALQRAARAGIVGAVRLDDIVLDERVARPAVDSEVAVAVGAVGARVVDGSDFVWFQFLESGTRF